MVADGFTRSSAADRNGIIISLANVMNWPAVGVNSRTATLIHYSFVGIDAP
jgi:hypothetical protein